MPNRFAPGNIAPPVALYAEAPVRAEVIQQLTATKQASSFATRAEFLHYISHEVSNTLHPDGRINLGTDAQGRVLANSVSPYAPIFAANIEPGIAPIVEALRKKRYLTYSSCAGHCLFSRRYVGIAFCSEETREAFARRIEAIPLLPGVTCRRLDRICNMRHRDLGDKKLAAIRSDTGAFYDRTDEVDGFNASFHRNYDAYYFLELIILDVTPAATGLRTFCQRHWRMFLKKHYWEKISARVAAEIQRDDFPIYKM